MTEQECCDVKREVCHDVIHEVCYDLAREEPSEETLRCHHGENLTTWSHNISNMKFLEAELETETVEEDTKEEEKKPETKKVLKTTWDWDLCNKAKPIWTRKPA